ncbi:GntR family transcriptional regulator [Gracilibacillus caseinilyticus]|uniref:GntR family transcriptional regulator n=1 Tax=Gracilibacillus caseinilyticus TaxID=2932256 RepID=A0ABY4EVG9_9BACI|nr:GntR family transcriptional regulator [Gracilibacillus caseinilyticus]UOQ48396.1 GntR family transcriptional regulator [Gracilibacillus caseinilyticus]
MANLGQRARGSSRDYVYNTIKAQIMNGEIAPGTKLSEKEISDKLNVSRTPVREAILKLNQEELLGVYPQIGTIVTKIDLKLVEEGRFIRENIEKAIVKEAAASMDEEALLQLETNLTLQEFSLEKESFQRLFELDDEFHQLLYTGCGKDRTWEMVKRMNIQFDRLRLLRLSVNHDWKIIVSQHREIFEAISAKDGLLAEKLVMDHLKLVNVEKNDLKRENPEFFI